MRNLRILLILAICYLLGLMAASLQGEPENDLREKDDPWAVSLVIAAP